MNPNTKTASVNLDLILVAAIAENGVIGKDGGMPWHYPRDLSHFRATTMGSPVIVGRVTYESILDQVGNPLDGRANIVMSSTLSEQSKSNVTVVHSLPNALKQAKIVSDDGVAYVIGGASVYEQTIPLASRIVVTKIPEQPTGDTWFPNWDSQIWTEVESRSAGALTFITYERCNA